jgi:cytidylate kinase
VSLIQKISKPPVIAIDGGAGTGKGSARMLVAMILGLLELDSGLLYRAVGLLSHERGTKALWDIIQIALSLNLETRGEVCLLDGVDRTVDLRSEFAGGLASKVAEIPEVRQALYSFQINARRFPGLVADGRDQGTIFEDSYRYFLTADPRVKAERRILQLKQFGISFDRDEVYEKILRRDHADTHRAVNPLVAHPDAVIIDTSTITREEVADIIVRDYKQKRGIP